MDASKDAGFHFGNLSVNECITKGVEVQNRNTLLSEKKAVNIFREYLHSLGLEDTDFFTFTEDELDFYLTSVWWNARTQKGEEYTASSMDTIRYSLNRALTNYGHNYDITHKNSVSFKKSIKAFHNAQKDRKKRGLGRVKNTPEIPAEDLNTIYTSPFLDPTNNVRSLQRKVQWDIRYYFARRGAENMHSMLKDHFEVITDKESGLKYVMISKDEETKNHKETDSDIISGFMPQIPDSKYCPVSSYERYFDALSPKSDKLWQTAKFEEFPMDGTRVFYYGRMGHNKLDNFVADVCELVGTKRYTNHCLRVTAVTNLSRENFSNKQIMSITGHKSSTSLEIYQKVNASEKIEMGKCLAASLSHEVNNRKRSATVSSPEENSENQNSNPKRALVEIPKQDDVDFNFSADDILQIVEQCEKATENYYVSNVNNNNNNQQVNNLMPKSPGTPSFNNCKIGNITINIQK